MASDVWMFGELSFRKAWMRVPILTSMTKIRGGAGCRGLDPTTRLPGFYFAAATEKCQRWEASGGLR